MSVQLPKLKQIPNRQEGVTAFAGLNRNLRIRDNEFSDMKNCGGRCFPHVAPREKRKILKKRTKWAYLKNYKNVA